jgi:signal transduction histidine kinase
LHIEPDNKDLRIAISDNGKGFEPAQISTGNGLNNMKKRANTLRGSFSLQSSPGKGTKITLVMPFHRIT